jgi:hypothetical protein
VVYEITKDAVTARKRLVPVRSWGYWHSGAGQRGPASRATGGQLGDEVLSACRVGAAPAPAG